jgi:EmrB/QacA subfamily drug resistance transporter
MLAPVGMAMLFRAFPPEERIRASSILVVPTAFAPALGPVLGGLLVTDLTWRWVFFVNVPIGLAAFLFGALFLPHGRQERAGRFDTAGFILSALGFGLFMYGFSEGPVAGWGTARVIGSLVAGFVALAVMVRVELRVPEPMVALRLLGNRLFRSANGVMILGSIAFLGVLYVVSLYYQDGRGLSALGSGLSTFPEAVGVMVGSQAATRVLYPTLGPRRHVSLGLLGVAISIGLMALLGPDTSLWWARLLMFTLGFSMASVFVPVQAVAFATISPAETGRGSTMFNAMRQLGGAVGVALLTTAIVIVGATHNVGGHAAPNLDAYRVAFVAAALIALAGIGAALTINDAEAANTMPARRAARRARSNRAPAEAAEEAPQLAG